MNEEQSDFSIEFDRLFSEFSQALAEGNMVKSSNIMNVIWVMFQIFSTSVSTELKELTYLKTPFTFDNGGKYILMFTHIDGPKIQLKESSGEGYTKPFEEIK